MLMTLMLILMLDLTRSYQKIFPLLAASMFENLSSPVDSYLWPLTKSKPFKTLDNCRLSYHLTRLKFALVSTKVTASRHQAAII